MVEFQRVGLKVECEREVSVFYFEELVGKQRLDLIIEEKIVLELKNVGALHPQHYAQLKSYLRASGCSVGLLVNFASQKADFRRIEIPFDQKIKSCGNRITKQS